MIIRIGLVPFVAAFMCSLFFCHTGATAADNTWTIDSNTSVARFTVKHFLLTSVSGEFETVTGKVNYDGKSLKTASVTAVINASRLNTHNKMRDEHLRGRDIFDVAKFPQIEFESEQVIPAADGKFRIVGKLSMHGHSKQVTLNAGQLAPIKTNSDGKISTSVIATTVINRKDFDIAVDRPIDNGGMLVGDDVKVSLNISIVKNED